MRFSKFLTLVGLAVGAFAVIGMLPNGFHSSTSSSTAKLFRPSSVVSSPTLQKAIDAHGGIETWQSYGAMRFSLRNWPLGKQAPLNDRHVADLRNRRHYVKGDSYEAGYTGSVAWVSPSPDALGLPASFYTKGAFYFLGMPFVWADPGVNADELGTSRYGGTSYDAVRISYEPGVGLSPKDEYVAFFDQETHRLKLIHFVPTFIGGPRRALVFEKHQRVEGLLVPSKATFYQWTNDGTTRGEGATYEIRKVSFESQLLGDKTFSPPTDAVTSRPEK